MKAKFFILHDYDISGEVAREIWSWSLLGMKGSRICTDVSGTVELEVEFVIFLDDGFKSCNGSLHQMSTWTSQMRSRSWHMLRHTIITLPRWKQLKWAAPGLAKWLSASRRTRFLSTSTKSLPETCFNGLRSPSRNCQTGPMRTPWLAFNSRCLNSTSTEPRKSHQGTHVSQKWECQSLLVWLLHCIVYAPETGMSFDMVTVILLEYKAGKDKVWYDHHHKNNDHDNDKDD